MSEKMSSEQWREWSRDSTERQGRERDLETYEGYLGFKREDLKGKTVLDLGTGETELFGRELKEAGVDANVISLNPDLSSEPHRKKLKRVSGWQKKSVAGIGQELPFKDESFDRIFALYSLTAFSSPTDKSEVALRWTREIARVLKPGGEAHLAPIFTDKIESVFKKEYKEIIEEAKKNGVEVQVEMITGKELDLGREKTYTARMIFRKLDGEI